MKTPIISPRTVEYLVGILATVLIAAGLLLYSVEEPQRITAAQEGQLQLDLGGAMTLYAENCSVCHGLAGEGIGATPALNRPDLRSADSVSLYKTIARGLFNTAMPAWSVEDGGPLGDYQITQMVQLIQSGDWQATQEVVVNSGLAPRLPFTTQADPQILANLATLPDGETLVRGVQLYAEQCVACHGADGLGSTLAPALNDPLVRQKTTEELARTIQNGVPGTLMAAWGNRLPATDLTALTTLLTRWDEVPAGAIPAPNEPVPVTAESLALGSELYSANCARCHGLEGQGTQRAPSLNVKSFLTGTNDAAIQQIITLGVPNTAMTAWGDRLTDSEIQALTGFIRSWEPNAPEVATPTRGPWWRTSTNGQSLPSGGQTAGRQGGGGGLQAGGGQQSTIWWQKIDIQMVILLIAWLAIGGGLIGGATLALGHINRTAH